MIMNTIVSPRVEVDIRRLLSKCEEMVNEESITNSWRLPKFVQTAEEMINMFQNTISNEKKDAIFNYMKRVNFLKGLLDTHKIEDPLGKSIAVQMLAAPSSVDSNAVKEIYQRSLAGCENDVRKELFQSSNSVRHRQSHTEPSGSQELDLMIKYHNKKHETITQDMLTMTRNLKEQSVLAGKVIREDTKILEHSVKTMDDNFSKLDKQSSRLEEFISKSSWNCWVWIMLAIIITVFLNAIFFMKVTKKRMTGTTK